MHETTEAVLVVCCRYSAYVIHSSTADEPAEIPVISVHMGAGGSVLDLEKLQRFDLWKPFQSPKTLAWSEKWPFGHYFRASLSCFQIPFTSFSLTRKDKRTALKRSLGKWCPAAYCKLPVHHQTAGNIKNHHIAQSVLSSLVERMKCFHLWWKAVVLATVLTSGAYSPGCRTSEGCEQSTVLLKRVYAVLQSCLPFSHHCQLAMHACPGPSRYGCTAHSPQLRWQSDPTLLLSNAGKKNTRQTIKQWNWRHNITEKESGRGNIFTRAGPPIVFTQN